MRNPWENEAQYNVKDVNSFKYLKAKIIELCVYATHKKAFTISFN